MTTELEMNAVRFQEVNIEEQDSHMRVDYFWQSIFYKGDACGDCLPSSIKASEMCTVLEPLKCRCGQVHKLCPNESSRFKRLKFEHRNTDWYSTS